MKFLFIVVTILLLGIYLINYIDYRRQAISRREFERRIRFFIVLTLIILFLFFYFR